MISLTALRKPRASNDHTTASSITTSRCRLQCCRKRTMTFIDLYHYHILYQMAHFRPLILQLTETLRFTINYKDWERDDIIRFIEFTTESIDGSPTDKYSCRHDDVIITHPTGQVIERELTHTGLYAFVHIRLFGGIRKISTQSLIPYSATPLP